MGLACQKCFSCWSRKREPEPCELSDAEMTILLRKVVNEDNSQKLLSILNQSLVNPNTPLPVTLQSQVDQKKLLCLLWTPLMLATYAQKLHVLRVLLDLQVVDVNAYDSSSIGRRRSALHLAARYNCLKSLEILANSPRVAINAKDADGCTALHLAVSTNNVRAVNILLRSKHDIDVNAKNNDGDTPGHIAAEGGMLAVMQSLMRHREFDVFAQDAQGRDVLERAQTSCAHLPPQPPESDETSSSGQPSVDECTQLIHLLSKHKARSTTDETVSDETKSYENLASVKQGLATNFAVRLMSVSEHPDTSVAETLWQVNNNLPLKFIGLAAPLGDVSEEDSVLLWNYLNNKTCEPAHEEQSISDTHEDDDEEQRSLIRTRAKAEHSRLLKIAIYSGDPTLAHFISSSISAAAELVTSSDCSSDIREALAWLHNPANATRCRDWCWSQWLCFFALHCDAFAACYEEHAPPHRHPLASLKRVSGDCYALEIVTKRHMYVIDVLKYEEMACAVSLKFHSELPPPSATEQAKRLAYNELLECGEHYNQPTSVAKKTLLSIAVETGMLECSLMRARAVLQQLQTGVRPG